MAKELSDRITSLIKEERFEDALKVLKTIPERQNQLYVGYANLVAYASSRIVEEYGGLCIMEDRNEYEKAKSGLGDCSPHQVLFEDANGNLEGTDEILDIIPDENPLKKYVIELGQEDQTILS